MYPLVVLLMPHYTLIFLHKRINFHHFLLEWKVFIFNIEVLKLRLAEVFLIELLDYFLFYFQKHPIIFIICGHILALLNSQQRLRKLL